MPTLWRRYVAIDPDNQSLSIEQDAAPSPGDGEVLIAVAAAGLNRADLLQRMGLYPPPADASPVMGLEVAGKVCAVGAGVEDWKVGDPVCSLTHGGGYADYAIAPAGQCLPIPANLGMEEAAALPEALLTIWHNIFQRAAMRRGEKVLIHGGASGIGTLGIQMVHAMGGEVYTTAGTAEKCSALEALGAVRAINYKDEDFEQALTDAGLKERINVILDMVGGEFIQKNINLAAAEGRIVNIAFIRGFQAEVNFAPLLIKRITLSGSTLRAQSFAQKTVMTREIREHIYPHLENGSVKPVVDRVFELADVAQAHDYMQSGAHMGKIILRTQEITHYG
ncbi:NAD(P)H-quinone oxidoreductase [Pseudohalioglobus lutimaris]|uniref:Zinc-binding dehydrogenase n=1 Tax=Pseudohalioglobus lutimaris TaxID=1737061 RepID=A0A2N5X416_9GAMM|nr:NAD(P)H-quinone oxidoreductase [Pseudohalioglobus lutimaris]PLW69229.1 zinc-binding dehydrogenase [Pseudohalioglobus lutimaris]